MKEYKIVKQKSSLLKASDAEFETDLNSHAREGWQVINIVYDSNQMIMKAVLEKDKHR
ncbi:DUF4177 domain-containing protein [Zobellia roscoffensis]|uniref:DUF4177 domain-containing protein n=1 Tax=Zobellia roscoffensis TaxID=2779508 RepID=UPI00188C72C1|nr:DUF4177 domain-containing protein [Zobellia roscoffensis]